MEINKLGSWLQEFFMERKFITRIKTEVNVKAKGEVHLSIPFVCVCVRRNTVKWSPYGQRLPLQKLSRQSWIEFLRTHTSLSLSTFFLLLFFLFLIKGKWNIKV